MTQNKENSNFHHFYKNTKIQYFKTAKKKSNYFKTIKNTKIILKNSKLKNPKNSKKKRS